MLNHLFPITLAPILRYEGLVFGAQTPIANFEVKMVLISWVSIVLNFVAILFNRTRLVFEILASSYNCMLEVNDRCLSS